MGRFIVAGLLLSALVVVCVQGHAKLNSPPAWNPNPSKSATCGGATPLTSQTSWSNNATQTIQWQTVAGDGLGYICAVVDPTGSSNPAAAAPSQCTASTPSCTAVKNPAANTPCLLASTGTSSPNPTTTVGAVVTYNMNLPLVSCGVGGATACTLSVFSSSSWYACATVSIDTTAPPTPSPYVSSGGPDCQVASNLVFCTMFNGLSLVLPTTGQTLNELDLLINSTYVANINSPLVFVSPNNANCQALYQRFICYSTFQICKTTTGPCEDACNNAINACGGLQTEHALLYVCSTLPQVNCNDDASVYSLNGQVLPGSCCTSGQIAGIVIGVVLGVALIGALVAFIIYRNYDRIQQYRNAPRKAPTPAGMI